MRKLGCRVLYIFCVLVQLWGAARCFGACKDSHYRMGRVFARTGARVVLDISVSPDDLAPEKLICLAGFLQREYRAREISIGIFSSHEAALEYFPLGVEYPKNAVRWASRQHAQYYYSAEGHEEYLLLIPDGLSLGVKSPFNTRIDLPATGKPSCKLEIGSRCLVQFKHIDLPAEEAPGDITLTGRIERSGKVTAVQVVADKSFSAPNPALTNFAQRNLESWIFEHAHHESDIKITYSLKRVETPLEHGINVQFMLPDKVNIEIGPMLMPHQ
jgi:hypothetical protein